MKNRSEKKRLDGNSFLLAVTIILFFVMYIVGIIMFGGRGFAKVQNFPQPVHIQRGPDCGGNRHDHCHDYRRYRHFRWFCGGHGVYDAGLDDGEGNIGAFPAILIVLATGCIFGLVQGFLVAYLKIQPFIVTLAGMFFARGMTSIISQEMISITNKTFTGIATFKMYLPFGGYLNKKGVMIYPYVYPSVIIALVVLAIVFVVLKYTKFGRSIYAIGGNEQSALLLGLNVRRIKLQAYVLDGFLAGLGGLLFCMNTCSGFVEQAKGFEMDAIASSVIGGTLLTGGVGNVIGSLFGVLIKGTIESFITFQGTLSSWWVRITIAALLCFFIVLQSLIAALKRKNK